MSKAIPAGLVAIACIAASGFDGHTVTQAGLALAISEVPTVTQRDVPVSVALVNQGTEPVAGSVEVSGLVDDTQAVGATRAEFALPAGGRETIAFAIRYRQGDDPQRLIAFQDDHRPDPPTSRWSGTIRYPRTVVLPEDAAGDYVIAWGIYDSQGILRLSGPPAQPAIGTPVQVGTLHVRRAADGIAEVTTSPPPSYVPPPERGNPGHAPVDFGFTVTDGAFRVQARQNALQLTPLPDHPPFGVTLRLEPLGAAGRSVARVVARDDGTAVEFHQEQGSVSLRHDGYAFAYDLEWR